MEDFEFAREFESCRILNARFGHRDHLRIAWWYVRCYGLDKAIDRMQHSIRRFAEQHGQNAKYHATLTEVWVRLVAAHVAGHPEGDFDAFIGQHDRLLEKELPLRFYSHERLFSDFARAQWIEPDIKNLPPPCPANEI